MSRALVEAEPTAVAALSMARAAGAADTEGAGMEPSEAMRFDLVGACFLLLVY